MHIISKNFIIIFSLALFVCLSITCPAFTRNKTVKNDIGVKNQIKRLNSNSSVERGDAALKLGAAGLNARESIPFLIKMLGDISGETQIRLKDNNVAIQTCRKYKFPGEVAAESLALIGNETIDLIIGAFKEKEFSNRPFAIDHAAYALSLIGGQAVEPLIETLKSENTNTRLLAVKALGQIDDNRMVDLFIEILTDKNENIEVRKIIAYYLGTKKADKVADTLISIIKNDNENKIIRGMAVLGVGHVEDDTVLDILICSLGDNSKFVRMNAEVALFDIVGKPAVEPLIGVLKNSDDPHKRASAAYILGKIKDQKSIDGLLKALNDSDENVRLKAKNALDNIKGTLGTLLK